MQSDSNMSKPLPNWKNTAKRSWRKTTPSKCTNFLSAANTEEEAHTLWGLAKNNTFVCDVCRRCFASYQALGGHKSRKCNVKVNYEQSSSLQPRKISKDSFCPTNPRASVQEAADENLTGNKSFIFDLNQDLPKEEDEFLMDPPKEDKDKKKLIFDLNKSPHEEEDDE